MDKTEPGICPVMGMFHAIRDYSPEWGYTESIYDDYGLVAVKNTPDSECSYKNDVRKTKKGKLIYDFQIPCKAHDYCSDLQRAGFHITDEDCDDQFLLLMQADCNNRSNAILRKKCSEDAETTHTRVGWFIFDPVVSPGWIKLQNSATQFCITVDLDSNSSIAKQLPCEDNNKQKFRIYPSYDDTENLPYIISHYPFKKSVQMTMWQISPTCLEVIENIFQLSLSVPQDVILDRSCDSPVRNSQEMIFTSPFNEDKYGISSLSKSDFCWKPRSTKNKAPILSVNCSNGALSSIFQWRIIK